MKWVNTYIIPTSSRWPFDRVLNTPWAGLVFDTYSVPYLHAMPFWYFVSYSHSKDFNTHRQKDGTNSYFHVFRLAPLEISENYASLGKIVFRKVGCPLLTTEMFSPWHVFLGIFWRTADSSEASFSQNVFDTSSDLVNGAFVILIFNFLMVTLNFICSSVKPKSCLCQVIFDAFRKGINRYPIFVASGIVSKFCF